MPTLYFISINAKQAKGKRNKNHSHQVRKTSYLGGEKNFNFIIILSNNFVLFHIHFIFFFFLVEAIRDKTYFWYFILPHLRPPPFF